MSLFLRKLGDCPPFLSYGPTSMSFTSKLLHNLGISLGPSLIRIMGSTWRIRNQGNTYYGDRQKGSLQRAVYGFWHCNIALMTYFGRNQGTCVLISRHRDGELIARIIGKLGYSVFRGSSTRGSLAAMRLLDEIKNDPSRCDIAFTPDGPRGPARKLKKGAIYAASRTGFPFVPIGCAVDRAWEFSSWDRFRVPKPFTRCFIHFGAEMKIPPDLSSKELERYRAEGEAAMYNMDALAREGLDKWLKGGAQQSPA
jgi:lysophospholipid acyltransferase (LPLAT)-like uncharacterized protein